MPAYLVWLSGFRGPTAQVWRDHVELYRTRSQRQILSVRELAEDEMHEPLNRLMRRYPPPHQVEF